MTWYIYQGEDLSRSQRIHFPFFRSLAAPLTSASLIFSDELIACDTILAAKYPKDGVTRVNCVLTADLSGVDRGFFRKKMSLEGGEYYEVHYSLVVTIMPAMMRFSLEVEGKEMGSVEARYD